MLRLISLRSHTRVSWWIIRGRGFSERYISPLNKEKSTKSDELICSSSPGADVGMMLTMMMIMGGIDEMDWLLKGKKEPEVFFFGRSSGNCVSCPFKFNAVAGGAICILLFTGAIISLHKGCSTLYSAFIEIWSGHECKWRVISVVNSHCVDLSKIHYTDSEANELSKKCLFFNHQQILNWDSHPRVKSFECTLHHTPNLGKNREKSDHVVLSVEFLSVQLGQEKRRRSLF